MIGKSFGCGATGNLYDGRMIPPSIHFTSKSPEQTVAWASEWVTALPAGTVIALHGDLGAGKTCLVQGLSKGLGVTGAVHSPTFTLINEYRGTLPLYHLDLYRLRGEHDAWEIGIDQYLQSDGITAIEWADRVTKLLPEKTIHVYLSHGEIINTRIVKVYTNGLI
jgi:tRNA threonylcarbamoyladenosine biosynthesis protein TsaE